MNNIRICTVILLSFVLEVAQAQEGSDAGVTGGGYNGGGAVEQAQQQANQDTAQAVDSAVNGNGGSEAISQAAEKGAEAVMAASAANPGPAAPAGPAAGSPGLGTASGGGPPTKSDALAKMRNAAVGVVCATCSMAAEGKAAGVKPPRAGSQIGGTAISAPRGPTGGSTSSAPGGGGRGGGGGGGGLPFFNGRDLMFGNGRLPPRL